jgi:hypothetical protein
MATENPVVGLLEDLKETNKMNDYEKNVIQKQKVQKQGYKVMRPIRRYETFRELMDANSNNIHGAVCGDIIYEYWDDRHFRSTWIERKKEKELWNKDVLDGAQGHDWKWRNFIRCRSVIEPRHPHALNEARVDKEYWMWRGVPADLLDGQWSDPTRVLGSQGGWHQGVIDWDQPIPEFELHNKTYGKGQDYTVEIENKDITAVL